MCERPAAKKLLFLVGEYVDRGVTGDKKILLHQSTALDELYPMVPLSQIVTCRKYFFSKMNLHVSWGSRAPILYVSTRSTFYIPLHPTSA